MKIDPEDFRRHYASLSDEALLDIDRGELVPIAQKIYDEEVARRDLLEDEAVEESSGEESSISRFDVDANWLEHAVCAHSTIIRTPGDDATQRTLQARDILNASGIPAEVKYRKEKNEDRNDVDLCEVMVPANLILYASSVLDKEIFNPEYEESYREYFRSLSDEELQLADRKLLFAGLVDRLERARKAYDDEAAKRAEAAGA